MGKQKLLPKQNNEQLKHYIISKYLFGTPFDFSKTGTGFQLPKARWCLLGRTQSEILLQRVAAPESLFVAHGSLPTRLLEHKVMFTKPPI